MDQRFCKIRFNNVPVYYLSLHSSKITVEMWKGAVVLHFYRTEVGYLKDKIHLKHTSQL